MSGAKDALECMVIAAQAATDRIVDATASEAFALGEASQGAVIEALRTHLADLLSTAEARVDYSGGAPGAQRAACDIMFEGLAAALKIIE